jgi:hypothetical protein
VGDHVHDDRAGDLDAAQRDRPIAAGRVQRQVAGGERPGQVARAEAVARELLAGQVHQPDVVGELAGGAHRQEHVGGEQQRRGRAVVVVGAGGGVAGAGPPACAACRRRRPPCTRCRSDRRARRRDVRSRPGITQITLRSRGPWSWLATQPWDHGMSNSVVQRNQWWPTTARWPRPARAIAAWWRRASSSASGRGRGRGPRRDAVGVVLGAPGGVGQLGDGPPVALLEVAGRGAREGARARRAAARGARRRDRSPAVRARGGRIGGVAGQGRAPRGPARVAIGRHQPGRQADGGSGAPSRARASSSLRTSWRASAWPAKPRSSAVQAGRSSARGHRWIGAAPGRLATSTRRRRRARAAPRRSVDDERQRAVPHHLARADPHRRPVEAIAEVAAAGDGARRRGHRCAIGARAVEDQAVVGGPHLRVARQRLVVEAEHAGSVENSASATAVGVVDRGVSSASRRTRCQRWVRRTRSRPRRG